ncbi:transcriptional regulator, TraR/DksA family [Rhizobium sp. RU20A]|uniref:TraR/DksA family transcriptional regulator n=1 Tax=Rhizobium sp. RU20A TaxID=1907412 RepID=UPI000954ADC8|nr:TraR/DksA family transcriptional regulator [Rhizobium sp. RU20A]SIR16895.1 transcriptional regulator, TraR/DksA family [Rhizobium sp. RU20A]
MSHVATQTEKARAGLLARKRDLFSRLVRIEKDLEAPVSADTGEQSVERENDEVLEGLGAAGQTEIRAIDAALDRISAGTYGICAACGEPIAPERLETLPHTPLCQSCATSR